MKAANASVGGLNLSSLRQELAPRGVRESLSFYPGQFHNQSLDGLSCSAARGSVLPSNRQRLTAVSMGPRIRPVGLDTVSLR